MFDSIAPRYDLLNHLLSFGVDRLWRRRMVGVVAAGTPAAILDVAAGTGDVAAVSYTHLDVYKRQDVGRTPLSVLFKLLYDR